MDIEGTHLPRLTTDGDNSGLPNQRIYRVDGSRDGRWFALSFGDEVRDVVMMNGFR